MQNTQLCNFMSKLTKLQVLNSMSALLREAHLPDVVLYPYLLSIRSDRQHGTQNMYQYLLKDIENLTNNTHNAWRASMSVNGFSANKVSCWRHIWYSFHNILHEQHSFLWSIVVMIRPFIPASTTLVASTLRICNYLFVCLAYIFFSR